ncbi:MAG: DUF2147 domain-containing protein [Bacteroidaceae bacterium]|nr:DUF2147 domain-containing protein [Bacteroidaceae bacterium]
MKKFLMMLVCGLMAVSSVSAQVKADDILGTYKAVQGGVNSKVEIRKNGDGYRAQVIWVDNLKKEDGTIRTDEKNPDKAKRSTPANQIVLVDKVTFDGQGEWKNGQIYDPTRGKSFKVRISFKDAKTLKVRGSWGPISETVYWTKL